MVGVVNVDQKGGFSGGRHDWRWMKFSTGQVTSAEPFLPRSLPVVKLYCIPIIFHNEFRFQL
jgi:hypothetical protein